MIQFFCPCGQPMAVKPEFIGRTGTCPRCKKPITVPAQSVTTPPSAPPGPAIVAPPPMRPPVPSGPTTQPYDRRPMATPPPPVAPPAGPAARLEVVHGPPNVLGKVFQLQGGKRNVIGRDATCEVPIPSDRVSRRHCLVDANPQGFVLEDLGSSNGTLVNQERIQGRRPLRGGEYIQAGDCLLRFTM